MYLDLEPAAGEKKFGRGFMQFYIRKPPNIRKPPVYVPSAQKRGAFLYAIHLIVKIQRISPPQAENFE